MRSKSFSRSPFLDAARSMNPRTLASLIFHLPKFIRLFSRLLGDPRVPYYLKLFVYGAILYCFFPLDLFRDLTFFGLGYVDDAILLFLALRKLVRDSPPEVVQEHVEAISGFRREAGQETQNNQEDSQETPREPRNITPRTNGRSTQG